MPELPEVETTVRLLRPGLVGRRLGRAEVLWPRTVGGQDPRAFARAVEGARVAALRRRGKFVVADLARRERPAGHLVVHLRMTGRLHVDRRGSAPGPWLRVAIELDRPRGASGGVLRFDDVRKFGRFRFAEEVSEVTGPLGPEPLGETFTPAAFHRALRERRRLLKPLLLDQTFVAGLGNIYVDEALHAARLHPLRRSDRLDAAAARRLWQAIRATLAAAIEREGSSFDAFYRTPEGRPGSYQHLFRVYGRDGKSCYGCGGTVRRIVVGQRGTHLCPRCQRAPRNGALVGTRDGR